VLIRAELAYGRFVVGARRTLFVAMPINWDDLEILGALDRLEDAGRAYSMNGEDLLQAVALGRSVEDADRNRFARMLLMLRDETPQRLRFDQQQWPGIQPPQPQQHEYLQSLWHFELTTSGRDRARGRVVLEGLPDPDQDDGRAIPALVLRGYAEIIAAYYTASQMEEFLYDFGLSEDRFARPVDDEDEKQQYLVNLFGLIEMGTPEMRRALRRFLARFVTGDLALVPTSEQSQRLTYALERAGWYVHGDTIVIGERRRAPLPAETPDVEPATLAGLHPLITEAAQELWDDGHRREAIHAAAIALLDAVRSQSGLQLDGHDLMARAFNPDNPRIVIAALRTDNGRNLQRGTHFMAMGAVAAIRNPASHTLAGHEEDQAREQLNVLSFIARRLDDALAAPPEWRGNV
jgi:uncharacterized protein (TIGR02391 family)